MVFASLSAGCLADILGGLDYDKPILQVLATKHINTGDGEGRFRFLLSDGKHIITHAMLASQLNSYAFENKFPDFTIIRVEKYIVSMVSSEKKVIVILELTILHSGAEVKTKIGDPQHLSQANITKKIGDPQNLIQANITKKPTACLNPIVTNQSTNSHGYSSTSNQSNSPSSLSVTTSIFSNVTTLISSLTPYYSKWVIRARVTSKTSMRTWSNKQGDGKLFSMDLMDESGEIRATCFNETADKFFDIIQADKVYYISKCRLKTANKKFSSINNEYELTLQNDTTVEEYVGDKDSIPTVTYNTVRFSEIEKMDANAIVDVAGICEHVGDIIEFTAKSTGRELKKRDVTLVDNSLTSVTLTLWGQDAQNFDGSSKPVIFIKGAKVNEFGGGKSVTLISGSCMKINPDISEAHRLRGWYDNDGHKEKFSNVSARTSGPIGSTDWLSFYEATQHELGSSDKPDYFQCNAIIHLIKTNSCAYKSCPKPDCNKKVVDLDNGTFRCERCDLSGPDFKYKILLNVSLADWTTNRWVTIFSDQAEKLLETTCEAVGRASDENKDDLNAIVNKVLFKSYTFKLRTKMEMVADMPRNKIQIMNISPVNYKEYNNYLIKNIQAFTGIGKN